MTEAAGVLGVIPPFSQGPKPSSSVQRGLLCRAALAPDKRVSTHPALPIDCMVVGNYPPARPSHPRSGDEAELIGLQSPVSDIACFVPCAAVARQAQQEPALQALR